jgi:hypothetical protein
VIGQRGQALVSLVGQGGHCPRRGDLGPMAAVVFALVRSAAVQAANRVEGRRAHLL